MNGTDDEFTDTDLLDRLQAAAALSDDGQWREAFALLREQEDEHPNDATLLGMLGVAARAVGEESRAYDYFRRCLAAGPSDPTLLVTVGNALAAVDDPEAESALRLAALTAPDLPLARRDYGAYLAREGILDSAIPELEAARALDPEDPSTHLELAVAYLLAGRLDQGADELEEVLARDSEDSWSRSLYGLALLELDRPEEAAVELHRAAVDGAQDSEVQLLAAVACAAQEWTDEAWSALARAEAIGMVDPELVREAEDSIEAGPDAARAFLVDELAPTALRERLAQRS